MPKPEVFWMPIQPSLPILTDAPPKGREFQLHEGETPSEQAIHLEHVAALEATLFAGLGARNQELVLELDDGHLRWADSTD